MGAVGGLGRDLGVGVGLAVELQWRASTRPVISLVKNNLLRGYNR